jgi:RNA polymerase sigma-70 factor (ECF subfamily)
MDEEFDEPEEEEIELIPEEVLLQFIAELPAGYRTVFNLHTFEELSHKEIAQLLNINEKSSSSQLARAKSVLAQRVREWIRENN